jgi:toxic cation resistance protein
MFKNTKQKVIVGVAGLVVVAALGTGFAYANGAFAPAATPEAPATVAKANVQRSMKQLTAANVTKAAANLTFAGTDVSVSNPVSVSIANGHVMVTETSSDTAANNVWYAPRRAAALAARLAETKVTDSADENKETDIKDVTYVVTDTEGNVKIAVTEEPTADAVATADKQTPLDETNPDEVKSTVVVEVTEDEAKHMDEVQPTAGTKTEASSSDAKTDSEKTSDATSDKKEDANATSTDTPAEAPKTDKVLNESTGFTMSEDTHDGLAEDEKANVATSGGKEVTDPAGTAITPAAPAPKQEAATEAEAPAPEKAETVAQNAPEPSYSAPAAPSNSNSYTAPSQPAQREKQKVWVVDRPAWDEQVPDGSYYQFTDGHIEYTDAGMNAYYKAQIKAGVRKLSYSVVETYKTIHHPEQGHWE